MQHDYDTWVTALGEAEDVDFDENQCQDGTLEALISHLVQNNPGNRNGYGPDEVEGLFSAMYENGVHVFSEEAVQRALASEIVTTDEDFTELSHMYALNLGQDSLDMMVSMADQMEWGDGDYESWYRAHCRKGEVSGEDSSGKLHWFQSNVIKAN
jgi:hypothetical protein